MLSIYNGDNVSYGGKRGIVVNTEPMEDGELIKVNFGTNVTGVFTNTNEVFALKDWTDADKVNIDNIGDFDWVPVDNFEIIG
jgi:hypothetical protein